MTKYALRIIVVFLIFVVTSGCASDRSGAPEYELDLTKIGTGQQAITPSYATNCPGGSEINMNRK